MIDKEIKISVEQAIQDFNVLDFQTACYKFWSTLGYKSERRFEQISYTDKEFTESFSRLHTLNDEKALIKDWKECLILFQLTDAEIKESITSSEQEDLFKDFTQKVNKTQINSYLFAAIELTGKDYTRTALATLTREINRCFAMPVLILFKYDEKLTLSVINRREHKKDSSKDVLEKVTLIKDINIENTHRAHIDILSELSINVLYSKYPFDNFVKLHIAWEKTLDLNELNKKFYKELSNWYFWAVQNVEFPDGEEVNREKRNSISVIRMLTRIIFIWFMKEKGLISDALFDQDRIKEIIKFDDYNNSSYYKAILQNLFFATLNTEMNKDVPNSRHFRREIVGYQNPDFNENNLFRYKNLFHNPNTVIQQYFDGIPFLNGGLFECLDYDKKENNITQYIRIDGFSDREDNVVKVPDELLLYDKTKDYDLNQIYNTKGKRYTVTGLLHILHSYKFTVAENTPIEEEIALDPELLGRVFENLLASYNPETQHTARKETGSFYTPREIVDFMVDESLIAYLNQKMNSSLESQCKENEIRLRLLFAYTDEEHLFSNAECDTLIQAIDECKALDPACGSGAFLMGLLLKMVYVLHKIDPHNTKWKEKQIKNITRLIDKAKENTDYKIRKEIIDKLQDSIENIKATFEDYEYDYSRKLFLVENCLYGVDIQPIAIQIAKLRFFISLLVDQIHNSEKSNLGVRPLPNLETNLIAADTLISVGYQQQLEILADSIIENYKKKIKDFHREHFAARNRKDKLEIRKRENEARGEFAHLLSKQHIPMETAQKIAMWNPYSSNDYALFFNPEIMFGIDKYDIVIGNPPYVEARNSLLKEEYKDILQEQVKTYIINTKPMVIPRGSDLLAYFVLKSLCLLSDNGYSCLLTQNSWLSTEYGRHLCKNLIENCNVLRVIDSDFKYFDTIQINTVISLMTLSGNTSNYINFEVFNSKFGDYQHIDVKREKKICYSDKSLRTYKWDLFFSDFDIIKYIDRIKIEGALYSQNKGISFGQGLNMVPIKYYNKENIDQYKLSKSCISHVFSTIDGAQFVLVDTNYYLVKESDRSDMNECNKLSTVNLSKRRIPLFILPRGIGRHFSAYNSIKSYSLSNVEIYCNWDISQDEVLRLWLFTNSSLFWLIREIQGRKNLGGGMLKAEAIDLKGIPLYYNFKLNDVTRSIYRDLSQRQALDTLKEIQTREHKLIDDVVSDYFGFSRDESESIRSTLSKVIERRSQKSKKPKL